MDRSDFDYALSLHFLLNGEQLAINQVVNEVEMPKKKDDECDVEVYEKIEVSFFNINVSCFMQLISHFI